MTAVSPDTQPRCSGCGRFVRRRPDGKPQDHAMWDGYNGGWEFTCFL